MFFHQTFSTDMDFFDRSKIPSDFDFPNIFNNKLTLNDQPSPPRKQFVEREVQTDESSFGGGGAGRFCANNLRKIKCTVFLCSAFVPAVPRRLPSERE
jgi:hypothetical protein